MTHLKVLLATAAAAVGFGVLAGCPSADPRTSNQGGGSLLSAGAKIAAEELDRLTPDEIQILADEVAARKGSAFQLSDEQASDAASFLSANRVKSVADLERLIAQFRADPDSIDVPESIESLFDEGVFS